MDAMRIESSGWNDRRACVGTPKHSLQRRAEEYLADATEPVRSHDEKIRLPLARKLDDFVTWRAQQQDALEPLAIPHAGRELIRCVDEYRLTAAPKALTETARHRQTATERHRAGDDGIKQAHATLSALTRAADSR